MSKKITIEEFMKRFRRNYPEAKIKLLNYTAISNPLTIRCVRCGKKYTKARARDFLNTFACCGAHPEVKKIDKLKKIYETSQEFEFVKQCNKDYFIVHHNKCGQDLKRVITAALDKPFACKYCQTAKFSQMISIEEVQSSLDERFFGEIQILDYNGQLKKNHYKCLKCGLIFVQQQTSLMQSRGCPKCDRCKSKGETFIANLLTDKRINYREQVSVEELPLQHFDFCVYDNDNNPIYFIEVQGEQHRERREIFKDSLEKIQERDQRKRQYCLQRNIPLYELIYQKGKFINLDILPLDSTTISEKESTLQANGSGNGSYLYG